LSQERGLVELIAKGARKAGSRLAGASEPLSVSELHVAKGRAREFVTQAQPVTSFPALRQDYDRLSAALAIAEIVSGVTPHERPDAELFGTVLLALRHLEEHPRPSVALAWAEVALLQVLGHLPSFDRCAETGQPIREAEPYFCPSAGGYLIQELALPKADKVRTKAEVLVGLARLTEQDAPPPNLKLVAESLRLLETLWREVAGVKLPAHQRFLEALAS
jgi:DNA repair protein RecO (recombination protein O)